MSDRLLPRQHRAFLIALALALGACSGGAPGGSPAPSRDVSLASVTPSAGPAGGDTLVTITVTNADGLAGTLLAAFTSVAPPPPAVTSVSPASGPDVGGNAVTLSGSGFQAGATVTFGGATAAVVSSTASSIAVTAPAHPAGAVDVIVTNPDGQARLLPAGYAFLPPAQLASIASASGPNAGGTSVALSWLRVPARHDGDDGP